MKKRLPKLKTIPTIVYEYRGWHVEYIPISGWDVFHKGDKFITRMYFDDSPRGEKLMKKEVDKMCND
jgi:hypothetical protein